jgi:IS30 family transposase
LCGYFHLQHRFGFPNTIITELGSNFYSHQFFCECSSIEVKYISVAHPWANGQVERTNSLILDGLKKRLYDKISLVVWGLRTQPSKATGQSPLFLVYGSKAILLADMMWKSP